jgi:membrane protease subunit HflK
MIMRYVIYAAVLLFLASLLTGVTQVRPGERAVVRRFGRVLDYKPGPGLWIGLPWGLDQVDRVAVDRFRRVTVGYDPAEEEKERPAGQLLTGDQNLVNVQLAIDYSIREEEVENYLVQKDRVDGLIARAAETIAAEWVAGHPVDYVLLSGKADLPQRLVPDQASPSCKLGLQHRLKDYCLGVKIEGASVTLLIPPEQVRSDFEAVNKAHNRMQTDKFEAEQVKTRLMGEAQIERERLLRDAEAFVEEQRRLAQTDAANFEKRLQEYRRLKATNPDYLRDLWLNGIKRAYALMLEKGGRVEPLDKLIGRDGVDIMQAPIGAGRK